MASISKTVAAVFFLSLALCHVAAAQSSSTKDILQGTKNIMSPQESAAEKQVKSLLKSVTEAVSKYSEEVSYGGSTVEEIKAGFKQLTYESFGFLNFTLTIDEDTAIDKISFVSPGLDEISEQISKLSGYLEGVESLNKVDAKLVVEPLSEFVQAQEKMLSAVDGVRVFFSSHPEVKYIVRSLVRLAQFFDKFAGELLAVIPTEASAAELQFKRLIETIKDVIQTYEGRPSVQMA